MLEYEHIDTAPLSEDIPKTDAMRWSNYLSVKWDNKDNMHLTNSVYIQPIFGDFADLRILNEFEIAAKIRKNLSIVISFIYRYDGRPPSEVKKSDLELRNGLRISF